MIIVMKTAASAADIQRVVSRVEASGFRAEVSEGEDRTVIGVIGHNAISLRDSFTHEEAVAEVIPITKPYKLSGREIRQAPRQIRVAGGPLIGAGGPVAVMAGPCSVESEAILVECARAIQSAGAAVLRGGAFKPRTSPYSFQGLGREGLAHLARAREVTGLPVITEVTTPGDVADVAAVADIVQIGARNSQNFELLREVGRCARPVLLKRGISGTVEELLLSAEYILREGNDDVMLCERGIRTFETATRNTLDISAVPLLKEQSSLPVIVDPSHATGRWSLVAACALAAVAAGADGLLIEVHPNPDEALSDGAQSLTPASFETLMVQLRAVAAAVGRSVASVAQVDARG